MSFFSPSGSSVSAEFVSSRFGLALSLIPFCLALLLLAPAFTAHAAADLPTDPSIAREPRTTLRERGISSGYGPRSISRFGKVTRVHKGIDIPAPTGSRILAYNDGEVITVGRNRTYGITVVVRQLDGRHARYAHMSKALVTVGQTVIRGEHIGAVGRTGRATGSHLHFELYEEDGALLDPAGHIWLGSELVIGPRDRELYTDAPGTRAAAIERLKGEPQYSD